MSGLENEMRGTIVLSRTITKKRRVAPADYARCCFRGCGTLIGAGAALAVNATGASS
jgi:hypothetical protein